MQSISLSGKHALQDAIAHQPETSVGDPDLGDIVLVRIQRVQDGARRTQRDFMLA
jgi:hypothetical protein